MALRISQEYKERVSREMAARAKAKKTFREREEWLSPDALKVLKPKGSTKMLWDNQLTRPQAEELLETHKENLLKLNEAQAEYERITGDTHGSHAAGVWAQQFHEKLAIEHYLVGLAMGRWPEAWTVANPMPDFGTGYIQ